MKKSVLTILGLLLLAATGSFAQGWVTLATTARQVWQEFILPGVGMVGTNNLDYALYWAPVGTADPLSAVGTQFGLRAQQPAVQQTATNGVAFNGAPGARNVFHLLTSAGWTLAMNDTSPAVGTIDSLGRIKYNSVDTIPNPFPLAGTVAGNTYEMVLVGWDANSGLGAVNNLNAFEAYFAVGWSNPFNYLTGVNQNDPNGLMLMSSPGCANQFGVIFSAPEPGQLALAASGAVLLLLFRRRARISEIPKSFGRGDQALPDAAKLPAEIERR